MNEIVYAEIYLHDLLTTTINFLSYLIAWRKMLNENKLNTIKSKSKNCNIHDVK